MAAAWGTLCFSPRSCSRATPTPHALAPEPASQGHEHKDLEGQAVAQKGFGRDRDPPGPRLGSWGIYPTPSKQ